MTMHLPLFIVISASVLFENVYCGSPVDMKKYFPSLNGDMSKVTWVHRCNTRSELDAALSSDAMMIESDIITGHLTIDPTGEEIPVMGHPPATEGDISLKEYLNVVLKRKRGKGIKLDFKSTAIFKASEKVLEELLNKPEVDFPVWINADILRGPGVPDTKVVVDAKHFLETCVNKFPTAYICVGWAVNFADAQPYKYEKKYINEMKTALRDAKVVQGVTFPVHSGVASNSVDTLSELVKTSADGTSHTLTLWAAKGEWVNYKKLQELINIVGKNKIYIDMPQEMIDKLNAQEESTGIVKILKLVFTSLTFFTFGWISASLPGIHQ